MSYYVLWNDGDDDILIEAPAGTTDLDGIVRDAARQLTAEQLGACDDSSADPSLYWEPILDYVCARLGGQVVKPSGACHLGVVLAAEADRRCLFGQAGLEGEGEP